MIRLCFMVLLQFFFVTVSSGQEIITSLTCSLVNDTGVEIQKKSGKESRRAERLLDVARKLIAVQKGQPLDTARLQASVEALQVCGLFERVKLRRIPGHLAFELTPAQYIRDIRFSGEYPLFNVDIEKTLSIHPGSIFRMNEMHQQDSIVRELYKREGFINPRVAVRLQEQSRGRRRDKIVGISISPGSYYRLKTIVISGNNAFSGLELRLKMKSYCASLLPGSAGRFIETVYRKDIKTLAEFYRSQRFSDITIEDTIIADPANQTIKAVVTINEGDRYTVLLPPKRCRCGISASDLKNSIVLYKYGNHNNLGIRRSVQAITRKMKDAGCNDAKVDVADTIISRHRYDERRITFTVDHRVRSVVSRITINGARSLDEKTLRAQMLHTDRGNEKKRAFIPDKLQEDIFAITTLYQSYGFLQATATSSVNKSGQNVFITINITEGKRTCIGAVSIDTAGFSGRTFSKALTVKTGAPYRPDQLKRDAYAIQAVVSEQGYPYAVITPRATFNSDSTRVDVVFTIVKGPQVMLGDVHFVGAFRTKRRVFNRELDVHEGAPFSLRGVVNSQRNLRDIGLFNNVRFRTIGLAEKRDTIHLFIEVAEKKSYYGAFGAGYQSDKNWFLNAKAGDRNIRGWNKDAWVKGEVSGTGYRVETGLLDPRLLGTHLNALVNIFQEQTSEQHQDWTSKAYGISNGLTIKIGKRLTTSLGTGYENRRLSYRESVSDTLTGTIPNDQRERNVFTATPSLLFDNRDSFTRPRTGTYLTASVDLSKSFDARSFDNFIKAQFEVKYFLSPHARLTLAYVLRGGYIRPYGSTTVIPPKDRLFYLGGTGDVRGFAENLLDTSGNVTSLSASIEARYEIGWNFEATVFTDVGRLERDFIHFSASQFRPSAGGGLRYITPIGPVGILYGRKISPHPGEQKGAWHFSMGYTF